MSEHAYSDAERAAIYRAIGERRDMRHFAGGHVAPELLGRLLAAAHRGTQRRPDAALAFHPHYPA